MTERRISMSKSAKKQAPVTSASTAAAVQPSQQKMVAGVGSKQSRVIAMLQSPAGATIAAMMKATDWQPHSVRGFLAGVVRKRFKLKLTSKTIAGTRVYQITRAAYASRQSRRRSA
jgi:hypothetical protein